MDAHIDHEAIRALLRVLKTTAPTSKKKATIGKGSARLDSLGFSYDTMLRAAYDAMHAARVDARRSITHALPVPKRCKVGGARTGWTNFTDTCVRMGRPPDHVSAFFTAELGLSHMVILPDKGWLVARARLDVQVLENGLRKYIETYVECRACRGWCTLLGRDTETRLWKLKCVECKSEATVPNPVQDRFLATTRSSRRTARNVEAC